MQPGIKVEGQDAEAGKLKEIISNELMHSVNDLQMGGSSPNRSGPMQSRGGG
jgi:hypothetical protein